MFKENVPRSVYTKRHTTQHQRKIKIKVENSTYQTELMAKEERPIIKFMKSIL